MNLVRQLLPYEIPALLIILASLRSRFVPVDPSAALSWWQSGLLWLQRWLTVYAPQGTIGIGGTRASVPLLHVPPLAKPGQTAPGGVARALLPLLFLFTLSSCGGLKPYYVSLSLAEQSVAAASKVFPDFDKAKRSQIVADAKTKEEGQKTLDDWDRTSLRVFAAITGTDAAVKLAHDGISEVAKGVRSQSDLSDWIGPVLQGASNLAALLRSVGVVNIPGVK